MSRLMVGNLSYDTNEQTLQQYLGSCGQITDCKVRVRNFFF